MSASANSGIKQQIEAMYPVTGIQRGMIFHSMLAPQSGVYILQDSIRFSAAFDPEVFWRAWEYVIQRHPVFRTLFVRLDTDQPVQVVLKQVLLPKVELDWTELPEAEQDSALRELLVSEQQRGFDFARAPLMRLHLIRCAEQSWYFVWTRHHVLLDGWSGPLVLRDVMACLSAFAAGREPELPPARGYQDYVRWVNSQNHDVAKSFWQSELSNFDLRTPLPMIQESTREQRQVEDLQAHAVLVDTSLKQQLDTFVKSERVTLNCVLQAAWALLLARYADLDAVTFGVTVSGRPPQLPGVESIVGPFINTLPMTIAIDGSARVGDWLRALQLRNAARADYEFMPLAEVQSLLPANSPAGGGLFDSLLVFDNYPVSARSSSASGPSAEPLTSFSYNNYPLTLMVMPGDSLLLQFKYDGACYSRAAVTQLLTHLQQLLGNLTASGEQRVAALTLVAADEQHALLVDAKGPDREASRDTIVSRVAAVATSDPTRPALVSGDVELTYAELDASANRLAHCLRAYGLQAGQRVGLCTARNPSLVIGLLGIMKAGGSYVPIDADWPEHRIAQVLSRAAASIVVTEQAMLDLVAGDGDRTVVSIDRDWAEISSFPATSPAISVCAEQLAYVIFTSGSTGTPKGVAVSHGAVVDYCDGVLERLGVFGTASFAALSTAAADLGHTALFGALCSGHTLRLLPESLSLDAHALHDELVRRPIDVLKIVPSHLEALLSAMPDQSLLPRQCLVLGGESPSGSLLQRIRALGACRIVNHYGPTEATVGALSCDLTATDRVLIGTPMAARRAYVLDRHLQILPAGALGELYLGGAALAQGYVDEPAQTALRFVPDPYATQPGSRMYRTGDRVRNVAGAGVQYLGRIDQQIKLRGFRIELGEIESAIRTLDGVQAAAVALQDAGHGETKLVAYVVGNVSLDDCASRVAAILPEPMRPSHWLPLHDLPLTRNGKLDRKALPGLAAVAAPVAAHVPPASGIEERIADVWRDLLKRDQIGRDDNFFQLGGNSLLIIQAHGRLKRMFGTELSVLDLFKYPTLAKLANHLRAGSQAPSEGVSQSGEPLKAHTPITEQLSHA
ncbi:hypothetical protein C7S18_08095 [Ahniella affigens]|uniref:Carrier domain-containing protein n=1 Tax=Ahniella affigens TaxID=2021234 RepID=A0A2P1PQN2_9GAMM|nr:non-ribosomal peptide synthetase [Ahniella affigens]AVP97156.1 hypothetical protein C7S18_08095 [Ahniella affigens]